jgi:hypothetical protein
MKRQRLPLDAALLKEQFEAFRKKFGREPKADDPIFFDPESDQPTPMPDSAMAEAFSELEAALDEIGAPPAVIYAVRKTKRLVTEENQRYLSAQEQEEWDAAICEYQTRIADESSAIDLCFSLPESIQSMKDQSRSTDEISVAAKLSLMTRTAYSDGISSFPLEGTFLNAWLSLVCMRLGVSQNSSDAFRTCLGANMNDIQSVLDKLATEFESRPEPDPSRDKTAKIEEIRSLPDSWLGEVPETRSDVREQTDRAFGQIQRLLAECRQVNIPIEAVERMLFRFWLRTWVINNDLPEAYFQKLDLHLDEVAARVDLYMTEYARPLQIIQ